MISKFELQSVINKYFLGGLIEGVKWDVKSNNLNIKFTAPTKEMIGEINYSNFNLVDSSVGISNTTQLLKLIGISGGEIHLDYIKNNKIFTKLIISDNHLWCIPGLFYFSLVCCCTLFLQHMKVAHLLLSQMILLIEW